MGHSRVSTELAMLIDGEREVDAVDVPTLRAEAARWHHSDDIDDRIRGLLDRFEGALEVAAQAVPQAPALLVDRLRDRAARLRAGSPAGG